MGKHPTSRTMVKRDLNQALTQLHNVQHYLVRDGVLYEPEHPKIYQMFCMLVMLCDQVEQGIKSLIDHI